ncbi:MAG: UDP-N-acetylmuramate dehydrogenase [Erysipelotrichaceae bacterium]|jgi:UDP-N-acetylmuramate dehydrogenase|nr:UDP-N-acetylmuramate dehydrogenase [Erysipelotrichaceae bacterium]
MKLKERLGAYGDVLTKESLKKHTTFKIGGNCRYFVYPKNELCLTQIMKIIQVEGLPYKVFGKGSNILCSDDDFPGIVICLDRYFTDFYFETDGTCVVQSGTSIILLAHEAMKRSFSGLEFASGIPGTVGGAVFMNAGAYKSDMSQIIQEVFVYRNGICEWINVQDLDFSYRHSVFQQHADWIVLGMRCQLIPGDQKEILDLMDSRRQRRMASQPLDRPCAGSMFRNPTQAQAWELIEKIGFRGKSIGGAKVSEKHANFIINDKNATAEDIMTLVTMIQKEVKEQFDIDLHTEVERFNWKK